MIWGASSSCPHISVALNETSVAQLRLGLAPSAEVASFVINTHVFFEKQQYFELFRITKQSCQYQAIANGELFLRKRNHGARVSHTVHVLSNCHANILHEVQTLQTSCRLWALDRLTSTSSFSHCHYYCRCKYHQWIKQRDSDSGFHFPSISNPSGQSLVSSTNVIGRKISYYAACVAT